MEITEKTKISLGLILVVVGLFITFVAVFASKEYVNLKVDPLEKLIERMDKRVDDIHKKFYPERSE